MKQKHRWPLIALGLSTLLQAGLDSQAAQAQDLTRDPLRSGPPDPADESIVLGMGCFWGAEKRLSELPGVIDVESGYANGEIEGTYDTILAHERIRRRGASDKRNHAEVVKVRFDPRRITLEQVLVKFWESHDPTQGDRQGNDVGSNYRSAIYTNSPEQTAVAERMRAHYQAALTQAGRGTITTEIAPLSVYVRAEEEHQDYLRKNPHGYCGLGGTGIAYPGTTSDIDKAAALPSPAPLDGATLAQARQLVVFEAEDCGACQHFKAEVLDHWQSPVAVARSLSFSAPTGWTLDKPLFATPTLVLFEDGREVARYTGYDGDSGRFWAWLGLQILTPEQRRVAFEQGTERAFTGSLLDEKRPGTFVDPITGAPLFRSETKFDSGSGWPSFFNPVDGAITFHEDVSHGMRRVEVRSASSGIHLGHVFEDGPPPTKRRYCINSRVLTFVPDL
ncbi:peptide-methionine (S)-S-oxide reductase MsrA [Allochromatium palmeri]|uniref:Peptide methionine sulfoxide reductase MsrA n=1 Tax=Allochromatium palmeri TaxID=231048 RepID=A0A6N8ELH8_9GAMM|nr:peptide-methionine (S)-S-oxide reductase MsrA [Allochromatium palmeri]MTW23194.1 peptide-methionine (S)-S-oxide reductase MsrA [Allochromatium palmeri]